MWNVRREIKHLAKNSYNFIFSVDVSNILIILRNIEEKRKQKGIGMATEAAVYEYYAAELAKAAAPKQ